MPISGVTVTPSKRGGIRVRPSPGKAHIGGEEKEFLTYKPLSYGATVLNERQERELPEPPRFHEVKELKYPGFAPEQYVAHHNQHGNMVHDDPAEDPFLSTDEESRQIDTSGIFEDEGSERMDAILPPYSHFPHAAPSALSGNAHLHGDEPRSDPPNMIVADFETPQPSTSKKGNKKPKTTPNGTAFILDTPNAALRALSQAAELDVRPQGRKTRTPKAAKKSQSSKRKLQEPEEDDSGEEQVIVESEYLDVSRKQKKESRYARSRNGPFSSEVERRVARAEAKAARAAGVEPPKQPRAKKAKLSAIKEAVEEQPSVTASESTTKGYSRKDKSLGLLCNRFLNMYGTERPHNIDLNETAATLDVPRRRIYDIVNVLESIGMLVKQAKSRYKWIGRSCLPEALEHVKNRDPDEEEFILPPKQALEYVRNREIERQRKGGPDDENRRDRSLHLMSEKFVKLFLTSKQPVISMDFATALLIGDEDLVEKAGGKMRTKVRRLYDIANVLQSLGLISKEHVPELNRAKDKHSKKPAYRWVGKDSGGFFDLCRGNVDAEDKSGADVLVAMQNSQVSQQYSSQASQGQSEDGYESVKRRPKTPTRKSPSRKAKTPTRKSPARKAKTAAALKTTSQLAGSPNRRPLSDARHNVQMVYHGGPSFSAHGLMGGHHWEKDNCIGRR
eukprot:Clim_evm77s88 gene=Clim_evmTU77s88